MARLVLALTALLAAQAAFAQEPTPTPTPLPPLDGDRPKPSAEGTPRPDGDRPKKNRDKGDWGPRDGDKRPPLPPPGDESMFQKFRQRLEQMSPEERQKFKDNWRRWKEMGDDERREWQKRAMEEHDKLKQNVDEALGKLGLKLDEDQREVFALRYRQERRKLEQSLCKEMDEKRKAGVEDILQRLKTEFSNPPKPEPSATPAQ